MAKVVRDEPDFMAFLHDGTLIQASRADFERSAYSLFFEYGVSGRFLDSASLD